MPSLGQAALRLRNEGLPFQATPARLLVVLG
jgi:hypothetical protein